MIYYAFKPIHNGCHKCNEAKYELRNLANLISSYHRKYGILPSNLSWKNELTKEYGNKLEKDPWGNNYYYHMFQLDNYDCFFIWSFGSDSIPGGLREYEKDIYGFNDQGNCFGDASSNMHL